MDAKRLDNPAFGCRAEIDRVIGEIEEVLSNDDPDLIKLQNLSTLRLQQLFEIELSDLQDEICARVMVVQASVRTMQTIGRNATRRPAEFGRECRSWLHACEHVLRRVRLLSNGIPRDYRLH